MTDQELNQKMERVMSENDLCWQQVHLWIMRKGYVIVTEAEYENMEVIDPNGPCP